MKSQSIFDRSTFLSLFYEPPSYEKCWNQGPQSARETMLSIANNKQGRTMAFSDTLCDPTLAYLGGQWLGIQFKGPILYRSWQGFRYGANEQGEMLLRHSILATRLSHSSSPASSLQYCLHGYMNPHFPKLSTNFLSLKIQDSKRIMPKRQTRKIRSRTWWKVVKFG